MASIEFEREERALIVSRLQRYFSDELDQDLGQFEAEFLLDFLGKEIGPYFYNRGLADARLVLEEKLAHIDEALYEIEQPTDYVR